MQSINQFGQASPRHVFNVTTGENKMKITINKSQFRDEFHRAGRGTHFSYEALGLLFDYFEECDPDMELDVIAICCEYCEMTPEQVCASYDVEIDDNIDYFLQENTIYVGKTSAGDFVFAQF